MSDTTTRTLVTFLGRVPRDAQGYRATTYRFPDGEASAPVAFFGWELARRLRPARLVILGTAGSMWDHLFEEDIDLGGEGERQRLALMEAVERKAVDQAMLESLAPLLSAALKMDVSLRIIPYCRTPEEQSALLRILAEEVGEGDRIALDITHGFRHLPMLMLLAAMYLRLAKGAEITGIWYGAYDPDTGEAPVMELSGLLHFMDWLQALHGFDKDDDYGVFAPLLAQAGAQDRLVDHLRRAAYFENILNVGEAAGELRKALAQMETARLDAPEAELVLPVLRERLTWVSEKKQFEKQIRLARHALDRDDYLRAVLYLYEAVITRLCQMARVDIQDFEGREWARKDYEEGLRASPKERDRYRLLKSLRNQVAHGTRPSQGEVQRVLLDRNRLRETLETLWQAVKNGDLPSEEVLKPLQG